MSDALDPSSPGWIPLAFGAIADKAQIKISVTEAEMVNLIRNAHGNAMAPIDMAKALIPGAMKLPAEALAAMPVLVAIGYMGGMVGCIGVVAAVASAKGYKITFSYRLHNLFDVTDDELLIILDPS